MDRVAKTPGTGTDGRVSPVIATPLGRRRRPSGEPPPLPRRLQASTRWYMLLAGVAVAAWVALSVRPLSEFITRCDLIVLRAIAAVRTGWVTRLMLDLDAIRSPWTIRFAALATIVVLGAFRRLMYLAAYLAVFLGITLLVSAMTLEIGRMRPAGIPILGHWSGYAQPAGPIAILALVIAGVLYTLVPPGPWRRRGKWAAAVILASVCVARLYLAVDHPTDQFTALIIGWAVPVVAFRFVVPEEAFPISYRGGQRAHLDIGGRRGEAIVRALDQQLGLDVKAVETFGLEASAGSTPLRLRTNSPEGDREVILFGKLYALSHLRSDRWYKFARTIIYGRLEDEKPFSTVRRLVEYEDHLLRLMRDAGLPTPKPYGFVEITPEREYLIVMEFFERSREIGQARVSDAIIDDALAIVRRMWDAGVAHRDIKPSNVLVRSGKVLLIDVAFTTVRPTPWRQAVDLANMMLTLALKTTPERVYERSLRAFAAEDVAEAFAASRSITIPTQLRSMVRADGRDLIGCFRSLAPKRPAVPIQLWGFRRVAVTAGLVVSLVLAIALLAAFTRVVGLL